MFNSMKSLLLAGALSLAAVSAVHATDGPGNPTDNNGRSHASAAPNCEGTGRTQKTANDGRLSRDWCRVIATEGPGGINDGNGRSQTADDTGPTNAGDHNGRSAGIETAHPVLATEGPPSGPGDNNGRSAALVTDTDQNDIAVSDWHPILAGGREPDHSPQWAT